MFETLVTWIAETIFRLGYPGILLLMALESSFFPFPSEVVLPPAGYLAAQGRMNAWLAFGAGWAGSVLGAVFNYYVAVSLGRPLLHRYSKYALIREESLDRAEEFFRRHGEISMFVGRLIPVIRQLISLPAGLARMRIDLFVLYTALGAGIWCAILTVIGWYVGKNAELVSGLDDLLAQPEFHRYSLLAFAVLLPALLILVGGYVLKQRRRKGKMSQASGDARDGG